MKNVIKYYRNHSGVWFCSISETNVYGIYLTEVSKKHGKENIILGQFIKNNNKYELEFREDIITILDKKTIRKLKYQSIIND